MFVGYAKVACFIWFILIWSWSCFLWASDRWAKENQQAVATVMSSRFERWAFGYELVGSRTNGTSQHVFQRHHSLTNTQANSLLGAHDLNTRLRVGNSSVNVYFRHQFKLNLLFIRHEFAVDSLIVRHEFTKTLLWLGMSLQKLSFY